MPKEEPLAVKKQLALEITSQFHGAAKAQASQKQFEQTFQQKAPEFKQTVKAKANLILTVASLVGSNSEAKRLITAGSVDVSGATVYDPTMEIKGGEEIKIGKKTFVKVKSK